MIFGLILTPSLSFFFQVPRNRSCLAEWTELQDSLKDKDGPGAIKSRDNDTLRLSIDPIKKCCIFCIIPMLLPLFVKIAAGPIQHLRRLRPPRGNTHFFFFQFSDKGQGDPHSSGKQQDPHDDMNGTNYSNWILARSAKFNHEVACLKRRYGRDRYNIHKLTNMEFMCSMINREDKYSLNLNENIVLLAQMNHVCNVLKKDKGTYTQFHSLTTRISQGIANPNDYICIGTFMNVLVDLGNFQQKLWILIMDALFVKKYDQQYDQLFGLYCGLHKYKQSIEQFSDYFELHRNKVIYNIPIIYRNSLQVMRQYVKYNVYNLKECRILFRSLHQNKINEKYFWKSVSIWFNIYIKEQLERKEFEQFFIVSESAVDKVLFDDGMIRPRSILEEVSEIAFILSEYGFISDRFVTFIENLINFSIEKGSVLFIQYLDIEKQETERQKKKEAKVINEHIKLTKESEEQALKAMEQKYKTVFVNPTDLSSESIIYMLIVIKRSLESHKKAQNEQSQQTLRYDQRKSNAIDQRVLNWLFVRLCQPKMRYTLNELLKVIQCEDFLHAMKINLRSLILQKVKDVRSKICSLDDLTNILQFLSKGEFESVSYILEDFLFRAHPKDILELTRLIERESVSAEDYQVLGEETGQAKGEREDKSGDSTVLKQQNKRWMAYMTNYFLKLPAAVNIHEKYYSFEQNCYFLYLLLKNQEYWESRIDYEYMGEMQKLKHSIKIASYSRGFKLQMGTYFYKLMNYIDLVSFFDGG